MMQGLLPRKLRLLRAERGLTLAEAAEKTGLTRETLGLLERGKRHPHTPSLYKIAEGYNVPVSELLDLVEEETTLAAGKDEAPETAQLREWIETAGHVQRMIREDIDELQRTSKRPRGWERGVFGAHLVHDKVGRLSEGAGETEVSFAAKKAANVILAEVSRFLDEVEKVEGKKIRPDLSVLLGGKEAV